MADPSTTTTSTSTTTTTTTADDPIKAALIKFKEDPSQSSLVFDTFKSGNERKALHELCEQLGLYSHSSGPQHKRIVTVTKTKQIIVTEEDKKLFVKDSGLPIPVWKSPYFEYFIDLYKDFLGTKELYDQFVEAVNSLRSKNKNFSNYTYELLNSIVDKIKSVPGYKNFTQDTDDKFKPGETPSQASIYTVSDDIWPKYYIAIDITKANFTALKFYNKELVLGCDTWAELVGKFTEVKYFTNAKYFRQATLGSLKVKKVASIQLYLLSYLYKLLKEKTSVKIVGRMSSDEIIVATTKENMLQDYTAVKSVVDALPETMKGVWRIEPVAVQPLGKSTVFVRKLFGEGNPEKIVKEEIKCVEKDFYAQAYKFYKGLKLTDYDMKSMKDIYLITYEDKVEF